MATLQQDGSVSLTWSPPSDPNGRITEYKLLRGLDPLYQGLDLQFVDTSAAGGQSYTYAVQAFTPAGGAVSERQFVQIPDGQPAGLQPPSLRVIDANRLRVTWKAPDEPNGLIISYFLLDATGAEVFNGKTTGTTLDVAAFSTHALAVRACNSRLCVTSSLSSSIETPPTTPGGQPAPVLSPRGSDTIGAVWEPPASINGDFDRYELYVRLASDSGPGKQVFSGAQSSVNIVDRLPFTAYEVRVAVYNKQVGDPGFSEWASITTGAQAPGDVPAPVVSDIGQRGASVTMSPPEQPNGEIFSFRVLVDGNTAADAADPGTVSLSGLRPFTRYNVVVEACTEGGCSLSAGSSFVTLPAVPEGPFPPSASARGPTALRLSWQEPEFANGAITGYKLHRTLDGEGEAVSNTFAADEFVFDDSVLPFTAYEYVLEVINTEGSAFSPPLRVISAEALAEGLEPPVVSVSGGTTVDVSWRAPLKENGALLSYRLRVRRTDLPGQASEVLFEGRTTSTTLDSLAPTASYEAAVEYVNSAGAASSEYASFTMLESAPTGFRTPPVLQAIDARSVKVIWSPPGSPNGALVRYVVNLGQAALTFDADTNVVTLKTLNPNQEYEVSVTACTAVGCATTEVATVTTPKAAPAVPADPLAEALDARTVQVSWSPPASPNQPIVRYELLRNGAVVFTGESLSFTDTQLNPSTTYAYIVIANNGFDSSQSSPVVTKTLDDSPAKIPPPTLTVLSPTSIAATWSVPEITNGDIVSYALLRDSDNAIVCKGEQLFSCTAEGLAIFSDHSFRVEACTLRGCGFSPRVSARTLPAAPTDLAAPTALVEAQSVLLRWDPPSSPNGDIDNYTLWVSGQFVDGAFADAETEVVPGEVDGTTTTTAAATTSAAPSLETLDLLDPNNHDRGVPVRGDGSYAFDGTAALRLTRHDARLSARFSIALDLVQQKGTHGYIFAKSDQFGNTWYSLYTTQTSNSVYFFYRVGTSRSMNFARFQFPLNDGVRHKLLLTVRLNDATLIVDGKTVRVFVTGCRGGGGGLCRVGTGSVSRSLCEPIRVRLCCRSCCLPAHACQPRPLT